MLRLFCDKCGREIQNWVQTEEFDIRDLEEPEKRKVIEEEDRYCELGDKTRLCRECAEDVWAFIVGDHKVLNGRIGIAALNKGGLKGVC